MVKVKHLLLVLILIISIVVLVNCSDNPKELQKNVFNPQLENELIDTTLYAEIDTTYLRETQLDNSFSNRLIIGEAAGAEARPILRFTNLRINAQYEDARIRFISNGVANPGGAVPFTATAYPVLNLWTTNRDSVWNDYTQNFDASLPFGQVEITPTAGDTTYLSLNQDALDRFTFWSDTANPAENYGIILDFPNATFLKYFASLNDANATDPLLIFRYRLPDDTTLYADSVAATYDAFVYSADVPANLNDRNYVSSLEVYTTLLKFNLDWILQKYPQGVEFITANLQMPVDTLSSLYDSRVTGNLRLYQLLTNVTSKDSIVVDSSASSVIALTQWSNDSRYLETSSGENRWRLARNILQQQLANLEAGTPYGFLIDFSAKTDFYGYLAFYRSDNIGQLPKPRLVVTYRIPPSPRF